jgi:DNA processing protein
MSSVSHFQDAESPVLSTPVMSIEEELHWLALRMVPGLGTRKAGQLIERFRSPQSIFRASRTELEGAGISGGVAQSILSGCAFEDAVEQQQKNARGRGRNDHDR